MPLQPPFVRTLREQAQTLRERALARMLYKLVPLADGRWLLGLYVPPAISYVHPLIAWSMRIAEGKFELQVYPPPFQTIRELLDWLRRDPESRRALSRIPLSSPRLDYGEQIEQLSEALQDLAELIAQEGHMALTSSFYPGLPEMGYISPRQVKAIMQAMEGELRREHMRVSLGAAYHGQPPPKLVLYSELPYERQLALAQRRRYWFHRFGIRRRQWRERRWSLWRVPDEPPPPGYELPPL